MVLETSLHPEDSGQLPLFVFLSHMADHFGPPIGILTTAVLTLSCMEAQTGERQTGRERERFSERGREGRMMS